MRVLSCNLTIQNEKALAAKISFIDFFAGTFKNRDCASFFFRLVFPFSVFENRTEAETKPIIRHISREEQQE